MQDKIEELIEKQLSARGGITQRLNVDDRSIKKIEKQLNEAEDWLPNFLDKDKYAWVSKVSRALEYSVWEAAAFCVALLEDVNAHEEAAAVNKILDRMTRV